MLLNRSKRLNRLIRLFRKVKGTEQPSQQYRKSHRLGRLAAKLPWEAKLLLSLKDSLKAE